MKKITLLSMVVAVFLFVGCGEKTKDATQEAVDKAGKSISEATDKAVKEVKESAE